MLRILSSLPLDIARYTAFRFVSQYLYPELLMAGLYLTIWIDPYVFGLKTFQGLSWGLWLEFLLGHAHTATGVVGMFSSKRHTRMIAVGVTSVFYLLFVLAISYALGSVLTTVLFVILTVKRVTMEHTDEGMVSEVLYAFLKVMLLLVAAAVGAGLGSLLPADIDLTDQGEKGAEFVPAWGMCYFIALFFYELKIAPKILKLDKK